ncbi:MAG: dTDP-4-dehydrorhamnose reductase [Methanomassiliicoccales archaeon]|jgi:dTDP-4-dehydrorhamnose reductase|nr:dTDP-4-dehydrorhamnose reductase [Methanomassiliicoccales archaeon]
MSRIAVIGASGLLGQYVVSEAGTKGHEVLGTFRNVPAQFEGVRTEFLDITNHDQVESVLGKFEPDQVILSAAQTNVDLCEKNPSEAWSINAEGTLNVASFCQSIGAKLLYVSTDYVFNGMKKGRYSESDDPDPLGIYAQTKLEGERITLDSSSVNLVCRVSTLYGWNRVSKKRNFVTWVIESLRRGESISLFADQFVSPTYAPHCAHVLVSLLECGAHGIYHTSGPDCLSRYEIGLKVAEVFQLDNSLIRAISTKDSGLVARRPCYSCLDVEKVEEKLGFKMLSLIDGLRRMLQEGSV